MTDRPAPPIEQPGFTWVAETDPGWRLSSSVKRCRFIGGSPRRHCPNQAVAELYRGGYRPAREGGYQRTHTWWSYCAEHLYGRWIEEDEILHWELRYEGEDDDYPF